MKFTLFGMLYVPWLLISDGYEWAAEHIADDWAEMYRPH